MRWYSALNPKIALFCSTYNDESSRGRKFLPRLFYTMIYSPQRHLTFFSTQYTLDGIFLN